MSTSAVAKPCDRLPMRMISPLRTYQVTPFASRSRVIRSVTSSTVPMASPVSMTSPTPYWSSRIMKTPERKSLTRLCAPKPIATPATPAEASRGPSGMPTSAMIVSTASVATTKVTMLRSSDPIVSTRCWLRSLASPVADASTRPARPDCANRRADFDVIVEHDPGDETVQQPPGDDGQDDREQDAQADGDEPAPAPGRRSG